MHTNSYRLRFGSPYHTMLVCLLLHGVFTLVETGEMALHCSFCNSGKNMCDRNNCYQSLLMNSTCKKKKINQRVNPPKRDLKLKRSYIKKNISFNNEVRDNLICISSKN